MCFPAFIYLVAFFFTAFVAGPGSLLLLPHTALAQDLQFGYPPVFEKWERENSPSETILKPPPDDPSIAENCRSLRRALDSGVRFRGRMKLDRPRFTVIELNGAIRAEFEGKTLCADQLTYNRDTKELRATGSVYLHERDGQVTRAEAMTFAAELHNFSSEGYTPPSALKRRACEDLAIGCLR